MQTRSRIRRTSKRATTMPRRSRELEAVGATLSLLFHGDLPSANGADSRHFESADIVTLAVPRSDVNTIAAALLFIGKPDTMELMHRLPGMWVRMKGAIQDR